VAGFCRYGVEDRVCFCDEQDRICEIPLTWTSLAAEDPFLILAAGKSWFRFEDLLEFGPLDSGVTGMMCKSNCAVNDKKITPDPEAGECGRKHLNTS
jgi:hypothetical protein